MIESPEIYQCYTCEMYSAFYDFSLNYGKDIYKILLPSGQILFNAYVGLWFAWTLVFKILLKGNFEWTDFIKSLMLFVFVESLLQGGDYFWTYIHNPCLSLTSAIAQKIITLGRGSMKASTFEGVIQTVDYSLNNTVFQTWDALMEESGWTSWKPAVAAIILIVPYLIVICIFLAFMLEFVFSMLVITAICPLLFIAICFKSLQKIVINAGQIALHGALTLIFSCIAMGFTLEVFHRFSPIIPAGSEGIHSEISNFIFSKQYWAIWILGFLSAFFHLKASSFAANISCLFHGGGKLASSVIEASRSVMSSNSIFKKTKGING